jgi:menaquinone-specific isochorismate synthase
MSVVEQPRLLPRDFLAQALERYAPQSQRAGRILVVCIDAPVGLPEAFLASTWLSHGVLWAPQLTTNFASAGVTRRIVAVGATRLEQLRRAVGDTFAAMDVLVGATRTPQLPEPPEVRFFGGLSFAPGTAGQAPWHEFGDCSFVLPRWTYAVDNQRGFLILALPPEEPLNPALVLEEYDGIIAGLTQTGVPLWTPTISTSSVTQLPLDTWQRMVSNAQERLNHGDLLKVVLARRSEVTIPPKVKDVTLLMRLRREIPECTRFAFRGLHTTFLGATPELLFAKTGSQLRTEALAGSIRCTGTDLDRLNEQSAKLLNSQKDLKEHSIVAEQIIRRIRRSFGTEPMYSRPQTVRFRNIIHLQTPIAAPLPPHVDGIAVLEALHPTAAVGGVPFDLASQCIVDVEPCARGWYAGPVGWIDRRGDAMFCVAIRSGLLAHPCAYVYAGAGIITESDPIAEYSETGLKQMPMMLALGVDSATLRATMTIAPPSGPK